MQQINTSQKTLPPTALSQNSKAEQPTVESLLPRAGSQPSNSLSKSIRSNRILQLLVYTTAMLVSTVTVANTVYLISSFVIAQLEAQQVLKDQQDQPKIDLAQQKFDRRQWENLSDNGLPQEQDALAESSAKRQLERAEQLASNNELKAAIVEANTIPFSSPLYQQAQQFISQWSEQMLQQDAEQKKMQQRLQAEHESNQRHLQLAQQALTQNNWSTALQEARQISNDPLWQLQRNAILQRAEPFEHEQKAKQFLDQGEPYNAIDEVDKLPRVAPWIEKRANIIKQANQRIADQGIAEKWNNRCRAWAKDNISRCPSVEDIKRVEELLPINWLSKLIPSAHKSKP